VKTVQQKYMKGKNEKEIASASKKEEKRKHVRCPYFNHNPKRICTRMVEQGLNGMVSEFDVKHFCKGNPFYCYYFRSGSSKK